MTAVVHPHTKPQHHHRSEQRRAAFQQLALGTADVDHIGRQGPGGEAGDQRQAPAEVDAAYCRLLAGVAQEGQDRRQHQNRLKAFAQQDQQAGDKAQRPTQAIAAQQFGRLLKLGLGFGQALLSLGYGQAVLQGLAVGHQGLFGVLARQGIDIVQRAFDQLEAFQVSRHRQVIGLVVVACAVGGQAFVQSAGGVLEQLRRAALDLRRLGPLGPERFYDRSAFVGGDFGRGMAGQVGDVPGLVAFAGFRLGGEAGDVGGHVPTLAVIQLVGKGRHLGAIDAKAQSVVEVEQAQLVEARDIAQVGGCRLQAHASRAVAGAGVAVADRAVLRIQRRAAGRVRSDYRGLADLVGHSQARAQLAGLPGDYRAVLALLDGLAQRLDALLQGCLFGMRRQAFEQVGQHRAELLLLAVFAIVDHLAVLYGWRVVGANVVQQVQGLGGLGGGFGQRRSTAQRQHRAEQ
ncbi:hypothetical protein D3C81_1041000 [compost metagenome]